MPKKVVIDFELKYKEAAKNLDEFQKEYAKLEKQVVDANKKTENALKKVEDQSKDSAKGITKVGTSIKTIGKVTGVVFLLQKAFEFIQEAISRNQTVMDGLNIVFETAQGIFNQTVGALIDIYDRVSENSEAFDALGRVLKNILTIAITPIKVGFQAIKAAIVGAQLAWEQSWLGNNDPQRIEELKGQLQDIKQEVIDIGTDAIQAGSDIITDFGEAVSEVSNIGKIAVEELSEVSVKAAYETAKTNVELKKSAEVAAAENRILLEQYDRQAEQQRQIRDEERNTIDERIAANEKLKETLDKQEQAMLSNADAILAAAEAQYELTGTDEDYIALLDARAEKEGVLATIEGLRSEQKANDLALDREKLDLQNSISDAESERNIENARFSAEMMDNELLRLQATKDILAEEKALEVQRLTEKRDLYKQGTQAYVDANNELLAYQDEIDRQQVQNEKALAEAKINAVQGALGNIASIVGENSKFGKAVAVTQAIIDTYAGASKALAQGGLFGFIGAAAVIASGLANVKTITSQKPPNAPSFATGGSGRGAATPTPAPAPVSTPPEVNTVGASGINQLAGAIGEQAQQPVQAYVVSNDVTTAQSLERNIVDGASIG